MEVQMSEQNDAGRELGKTGIRAYKMAPSADFEKAARRRGSKLFGKKKAGEPGAGLSSPVGYRRIGDR